MGLSKVKINILNGQTGSTTPTVDGTAGLILTGVTVAGTNKVTVDVPFQIFSLQEAVDKGIEDTGVNAYAYSQIKGFYDAFATGAELWLMLVDAAVTMEDMLDKTKAYAPVLINASKGAIRKFGVSRESGAGVVVADGLDEDVDKALIKGQDLADDFANEQKPFRFLVDGKDFNGTTGDLKDYTEANFNRGGVLLGSIVANSKNAAVGFAIGTMASLPVQRKISRVKNGALAISDAYFTDQTPSEDLQTAWESIANKGYIFFREHPRKSGWFFSSDTTATSGSDDFGSFARGFVIDKAHLITYGVYVEELDDELDTDEDGNISGGALKALQDVIEDTISAQMIPDEAITVNANIDPKQDVIGSGILNISLGIQPKAYKQIINVDLGLTNPANN